MYNFNIIQFKIKELTLLLNPGENLNYSFKNKLKVSAKENLLMLMKDTLFIFTLAILFIKSVLFIWLINSEKATTINFGWSFYGNAHISVYISFIAIILSFSFLLIKRAHVWYLILANLFVTIIIISDLWYFRGFDSFITLHIFSQGTNLDNLSSSILSMMRSIDLIFVLDLLILIPLGFVFKKIYHTARRSFSLFIVILSVSISLIYFSHYLIDISKKIPNTILFRICWTPKQTMANLSPIGYHIYDAYNYWKDNTPYILTSDEKKEIETWFDEKKENLPDNKYKGMFKGKNLIVLQVESLENFVINKKIDNQEITPNLNKILKNSIYFNNYHEQVYNGTSSDADLLTNTSVYPVRRGSTFFRFPNNTYNSLPKLLEEMGYSTTAIHPDKGSYWNWMPALKSIGFQDTIDSSYFKIDETIGLGLSDGSYLKQIEPIIKNQKNPFYTFMVTLTSHSPFDLPKEYRDLKLEEYLDNTKLGGYFQSVHYTDKHIGMLLDKLEADGILDDSILVIYGDHTGIHKFYQDEVEAISPQEDWWSGNNLRVPLFIYEKGYTGEVVDTIGGQVDLLPTLAYVMGIEKEKYESTSFGRNLLNTKRNFAVLANGKYIGEKTNDKEEQNAVKGIELSDKIIRSNYFKSK